MNDMTYEIALKKLEDIVEKIENGDLTLDENIKLFEEGVKLSDFCSKCLNEAELKIKDISEIKEEME